MLGIFWENASYVPSTTVACGRHHSINPSFEFPMKPEWRKVVDRRMYAPTKGMTIFRISSLSRRLPMSEQKLNNGQMPVPSSVR